MHKFERKYAFWFNGKSTSIFCGEVLDIRQDSYLIKPSNDNNCPSVIVKEVFIIVPYIDGIRIQKDLDKEVIK